MNNQFTPYAAVAGGVAWALAFLVGARTDENWTMLAILFALALLLITHVGLSRAEWVMLPILGGGLFFIGALLAPTDVRVIGIAGWDLMWIGLLSFLAAEVLFAVRANAPAAGLPRPALGVMGLGAAVQAIGLVGLMTGVVTNVALPLIGVAIFAAGWIWIGLALLHSHRPTIARVRETSL